MEAGLLCEHSRHDCRQKPLINPCYIHIGLCFGKLLSAEQKSSFQILESSNDQDHADGNFERLSIVAFLEAFGDDSNLICSHDPHASHGVTQDAIHSHIASQGIGAVIVRVAMY
jgi:hypothetical protein